MMNKKKVIFVVVEERIVADTLTLILRRRHFDAKSFYSPGAAIQAAAQFSPLLLISDVKMPTITGIDLALRFRSLHPACRILLFSGRANTAALLNEADLRKHDFEILNKRIHPIDHLARSCSSQPVSGRYEGREGFEMALADGAI